MFKIGDKVRVIKDYFNAKKGDEGVVMALPGDNGDSSPAFQDCYAVDFGEGFDGHMCGGKLKMQTGHWMKPSDIELIKPKTKLKPKDEKIVITHDGHTTLARLYDGKTVVKSAEAKCDPRDEFDFAVGAKLAFERLTAEKKEEPPKFDKAMLTNGRFGCTSDGKWFVVVGDHFVYEKGGWDEVSDINNEGIGEYYSIKYIVDANAFEYAKDKWAKVIWKAPGFNWR